MFHIGVSRAFRTRHFLLGNDRGAENVVHAHDYRAEWILQGTALDAEGFLLDLSRVDTLLESVLEPLAGQTLNDLPFFRGLNPSVERLCRFLSDRLLADRGQWDPDFRVRESVVKVYEHDAAWASYTEHTGSPTP